MLEGGKAYLFCCTQNIYYTESSPDTFLAPFLQYTYRIMPRNRNPGRNAQNQANPSKSQHEVRYDSEVTDRLLDLRLDETESILTDDVQPLLGRIASGEEKGKGKMVDGVPQEEEFEICDADGRPEKINEAATTNKLPTTNPPATTIPSPGRNARRNKPGREKRRRDQASNAQASNAQLSNTQPSDTRPSNTRPSTTQPSSTQPSSN